MGMGFVRILYKAWNQSSLVERMAEPLIYGHNESLVSTINWDVDSK